ncbi:MAG: hypothetical protein V4708_11085 [Bacteroidota bacterium]
MTLNKKLSFWLKGLFPDPEGGRMFIVMGIPDIRPRRWSHVSEIFTCDHLRGREKG